METNRLNPAVKAVTDTSWMPRIYFLDNLKIFLTTLVVFHHAAQPYGPGGSWPIVDSYSTLDFIVLALFMVLNASFFMGLFFMISAYFVPSSLERKGVGKYMKDRLVKLGVPIVIFMLIIFPMMDYLLKGQLSTGLGHLWYLELLLMFSTVYAGYWLIKKPSTGIKKAFPRTKAIAAFAVCMALASFVVRIWAPENQWVPLGLFEPFHLAQYAMMFTAGTIAYREGWIDAIPKAAAKLWSRLAIVIFILFLFVDKLTGSTEFSGGLTIGSLIGSFWEAFMCVSMCTALLALFKNRFNSQNPITKALANNAFTVYIIHLPIVIVLQYLLVAVPIDSLIKFAIAGTIGVILSFAISHYIIRRLPYAKYILG